MDLSTRRRVFAMALIAGLCIGSGVRADDGGARLPVREVTVFKDGNAFVLREGAMPVTADHRVLLTDLPNPVIGTFWPYTNQAGVTLRSVTASRHKAATERPALNIREILEANVGKRATIQEINGAPYEARIVAVPHADVSSDDDNPLTGALPRPPQENAGDLLLLQTEQGLKAISLIRVQEVTLLDPPKQTRTSDAWRNDLSLQLSGGRAGGTANVGVLYLQPGIRWIPSYKIVLDGKGEAKVQLQATLLNELTDLDDATVNLVIGVPTFAFKDTPDPIGLQDTFARLSRYFQTDVRTPGALSNAIMTQGFRAGEATYSRGGGGDTPPAPAVTEGEKAEDLFVFTVKNVRLKRYERMVVPVAEFTLAYKNVYSAELLPSSGYRTRTGYETVVENNNEALRLLQQPRVQHKLRFTNGSPYPLTTAPALVLRDGRVISQGMMTYTSRGGTSDLPLTDASDVTIKRTDVETKRTTSTTDEADIRPRQVGGIPPRNGSLPRIVGALRIDGTTYERVDMAGTIELRNYRTEPVEIEVTRYLLGGADSASQSGAISALDPFGDDALPDWLSQYNAGERIRFTGLGKVFWKQTVPPGGDCLTLNYAWHYFTR